MNLGILPVEGVVSIVLAERNGWWGESIQARTVLFESAEARDAALARRELDVAFMDALTAALLRHRGLDVKVLTALHRGRKDIVAAPRSLARSLADVPEVAVSLGTTIEYYTDRMLERHGIDPARVRKREVASIPERLERLLRGEVAAACLPMPFAQVAIARGGRVLASNRDLRPPLLESALVARAGWLTRHRDEARRLLRALCRSIEAINADPLVHQRLTLETARVPPELEADFTVERHPALPGYPREYHQEFAGWLLAKGALSRPMPYEELVDLELSREVAQAASAAPRPDTRAPG